NRVCQQAMAQCRFVVLTAVLAVAGCREAEPKGQDPDQKVPAPKVRKLADVDDKAARAIVVKSIAAHGGADNILKLRTAKVSYTSSLRFPDEGEVVVRVDDTYQLPDQFKKVTKGSHQGKNIDLTWAVIDGGQRWWQVEGSGPSRMVEEQKDIEG